MQEMQQDNGALHVVTKKKNPHCFNVPHNLVLLLKNKLMPQCIPTQRLVLFRI